MEEVVAYLGPVGSYSEVAAKRICKNARMLPLPGFRAVFEAVSSGKVTCGVIPLENSVNGAVTQNLDLLSEFSDIIVKEEAVINIDHRLATYNGADFGLIKRIYSHPQAFGQCSEFLNKNFPEVKLVATSSTSDAIGKVVSPSDAAIVGSHVVAPNITLSPQNIADRKTNCTYFFRIIKGEYVPVVNSRRLFFAFTCRHKPGQLIEILSVLAKNNINMTEIGSRPIKERPGEFVFYIEIETNVPRSVLTAAMSEIGEKSLSFRIFGEY